MKKFVYVGQFETFWRLTPDEWEQVCRTGAKGQGYDLSPFKQMAGRPIWLKRHPDGKGFYRTRNDMLYFEPLDWDSADFKEALEELEQMRNSGELS